jgi:hypothetical protein
MKYWFTHLHRAVVKEVFSFILRFMALLKGLVKTLEYITALGERRKRERKKMSHKKLSQHSLLKDDNQHP